MKIIYFLVVLFLPLSILAAPLAGVNEKTGSLITHYSDRFFMDPRLSLSLEINYAAFSGKAYAKEIGRYKYYLSEDSDSLDLRENFGVDDMIFYEAAVDWRLNKRNHLSVIYSIGQNQGIGEIDWTIGFDDDTFNGPTDTRGDVMLQYARFEWYMKAIEFKNRYGAFQFDVGAGFSSMYSTYRLISIDDPDTDQTEQVSTPFIPYLLLHAKWQPRNDLVIGANLISGSSDHEILKTGLLKEESDGFYHEVEVYCLYPLSEHLSFYGGIKLDSIEIDFDGIEDDEYSNEASNEIEIYMTSANLGFTFNDPHKLAVGFFKRLLNY